MVSRKKIYTVLCIFLFFNLYVSAGNVEIFSQREDSLSLIYRFPQLKSVEKNGYDYLSVEECTDLVETGKPIIPVRIAKILLPENKSLGKISATTFFKQQQGIYNLATAQEPVRIGQPPRAYITFSGIFPEKPYEVIKVDRCMGYNIAIIKLYPITYDTSTKSIAYTNAIKLDISFNTESTLKNVAYDILPRRLENDKQFISSLVDNSADISKSSFGTKEFKASGQVYDYIIITNTDLKSSFQTLANYIQSNRGLTVKIFDTADIYTIGRPYYQTGRDNQEKIRNFIKYAYTNWNTQYVLLGGYANIIPVRYLQNPNPDEGPIPSDVYYSNLDGDWNYNGNNVFGEYHDGPGGGDIDTSAEVFVGRAPVWDSTDVNNLTNKIISYNQTTWKLKKAGFLGKQLNNYVPTWGGDGVDAIIRDCMPDDWEIRRFYERDNTYDISKILNYINEGTQLISGLTHGGPESSLGLSIANVCSLRNTDYFLIYTQSCNGAAFDSPEDGKCIAEYFVTEPYASAAFIGNTRSGWYNPYSPEFGSSNVFHKEFFNILFNQNVTILGQAFHRHKDNLSIHRYLYYELILFGDPSMPVIEPRVVSEPVTEGYTYYVKNDNIWQYSMATGASIQLTYFGTGSGNIQNLNVTEDGEQIIFARGSEGSYQLFSINADGSGLENLTTKYNLSSATVNQTYGTLNSTGDILAFTAIKTGSSLTGTQLWVKELTGSKRLRQLTLGNWNCSYPSFVDNNYILFKTTNFSDTLEDYYLITTAGTNLTNRTNNNSLSPYFPRIGRPVLNRDKTTIIYAQQSQFSEGYSNWTIYTMPVWSGVVSPVLTNLYYNQVPENQPDPMPIILRNGDIIFRGVSSDSGDQYLYYTISNSTNPYLHQLNNTFNAIYPCFFLPLAKPVHFSYITDGQVYLRNYKGTDIQLTDTVNANDDPVFNSTGVYIAYSGNGIWVMKANGTQATQIDSAFAARYPAFSPDSNWLVYVKDNDIYARRVDKTVAPQKLTSTPTYPKSDLSFAPDGKKILYTMVSGGISRIYFIPVSVFDSYIRVNSEPICLTATGTYNNYHAQWSYTGDSIIYISTVTGSPAIYTMNPDGSNKQKIQFSYIPANPSFPAFSPYPEQKISYINNGNIWVADLQKQIEEIISPVIATTKKFSWAQEQVKKVDIKRQFILKQADVSVDFVYNIIITPNELSPLTSLILTEILPTKPESGVNWKLANAYWNGEICMPTNGATTGTLKWVLGTESPLNGEGLMFEGGVMNIILKLTGDGPIGSIRNLNGGIFDGEKYYSTSGDAYITIGDPFIPVDSDENWTIDDSELLIAIDYWAINSRIGGWPTDTDDWDMYLLLLIDFWANDGYRYIQGENRWETVD